MDLYMKNSSNNQLSQEQLNEVASLINKKGMFVPSILKTIDLQDIYYALQNEEISSKLSNENSTINLSTWDDADKIKNFILSFNDSSFKPESIIIAEPIVTKCIQKIVFTEPQMIALGIKTGINVHGDMQEQPRKKILIEKLYNLLIENNLELEQEKLVEFVKIASQEAKSTDGLAMQDIQALRILSTFDFSEIDEKYSILQSKFKELYSQQEVKSEIHHLQKAEDLHFYMVKVTGANASEWKDFNKLQFETAKYSSSLQKLSIGLNAFKPSIGYHDQDLTDTYVAFVANKPWDRTDKIDPASIEIAVTMMTSEHAHFISHAGISRTATYKGQEHKNLAVQLHSFIAACAKDIYGEQKEYMITPPAEVMRDIIIHAFIKNNAFTKIFIGHQDQKDIPIMKYQENVLEALIDATSSTKPVELIKYINSKSPIKYIESGKNPELTIYGKNGEILDDLKTKDMAGEFAWFCKSPFLLRNQYNAEPLLTCDLDTLAKLATPAGSIEHNYYTETIGDAMPYPEIYL